MVDVVGAMLVASVGDVGAPLVGMLDVDSACGPPPPVVGDPFAGP